MYMSSYFTLRQTLSMNTLSMARPLPSMLIAIWSAFSREMKSSQVNCTPWSVLNISGVAMPSASSRASTQNDASREFDIRQERTYLLYQSITATRYIYPLYIYTYVISAHHTWLGRLMSRPRSKYGYLTCSLEGIVVRGRGYIVCMSMIPRSRRTRLWFMEMHRVSSSQSVILMTPS